MNDDDKIMLELCKGFQSEAEHSKVKLDEETKKKTVFSVNIEYWRI